MELAFIAYEQGRYLSAIGYCLQCVNIPIPPTPLWREENKYTDQPPRLISWCYEHQGDLPRALLWAKAAQGKIGAPDKEWDERIARLEQGVRVYGGAPAIVKSRIKTAIALHRPGAIGDILMTLNLIPALREANPWMAIHYYCDAKLAEPDALGDIMRQAGVDAVFDCAMFDADEYERAINLVGYPLHEGYPDKPMSTHLIHYFAHEMGLRLDALPSLTLRRPQLNTELKPYITVQPKAGWSKYKQWPLERWVEVYEALPDITFFVVARMHIGVDSFCNHLTNYIWTDEDGKNGRRVPGLILWGSTQASAAGYPTNTNISLGLRCQPCFRENPAVSRMPRGPCVNPPRPTYDDDTPWACMDRIDVQTVVNAVKSMWERTG
jgi:hypothetical protein